MQYLEHRIGFGSSVQGSQSMFISLSRGEEWRCCLGCAGWQSSGHCSFLQHRSKHPSKSGRTATPGKRWGRYSFCLLEEGSLLSISRSSCIGAQRAVGKTLTGLSGTISYTRYLLLLLMSRYYHSCICICVTVIVTIKLFKFQVSFKTFQKSVWKTSITTMAMTCIWPLMNSRERWQGGVTDGQ